VSAYHPVRQDLRALWLGGARRGQGGRGGLAVQFGRQFSTPRRAEARSEWRCIAASAGARPKGGMVVIGDPQRSDQTTKGARDEGALSEASEYVEVCPRCGQSFDSRILHQVIYHDQPEHKPIETHS
jgi:hypothetical protein